MELTAFESVRRQTRELAALLSPEDCCVQSMPDCSPIKWHLAHTTWFFETFVLEKFEKDFQPYHPLFRQLFNSYYNEIGNRQPRYQRCLLTRPSLEDVHDYRDHVDARMRELLKTEISTEISKLIELGLYHEQQHQELILTDVKHLLSMNPLQPSYSEADLFGETSQAGPSAWQTLQGGLIEVGHSGGGFCFDNEKPRHRRFVEPFQIASSLVTNRDFLEFLKVGGYHDPLYWLSDGWDWISQNHITHPLYWHSTEGDWKEFTLQGLKELDLQRPVTHISYFEAEAFARWSEARLPTEFEWEHAASSVEMAEIFGTAWQWTASGYDPYPGFTTAEGVIGEYNGKFMVNQYVLRGASWATPLESFRKTYRNFFPATARWQITGIRLARSGVP